MTWPPRAEPGIASRDPSNNHTSHSFPKGAHMIDEAISTRVKEVMVEVLELDLAPAQLCDAEPLYSALIRLDSLTLLQLITELEGAFGCQIDDEAVMAAELDNVASIVALVASQLARGDVVCPVDAAPER